MAQSTRYRIHPAIGIARVGDAPANEFFLGPEQPNQPAGGVPGVGETVPPYKVGGRIRRQAARFRVFEYVEKNGVWTVSREITADLNDVAELKWTVHLANHKASFFEFNGLAGSPLLPRQPKLKRRNETVSDRRTLEIDPLPRSITGRSAKPVPFSKGTSANPANEAWPTPAPAPALEYIGELRTDHRGRLIVIGGAGVTASQPGANAINAYANNDGWFDDVSDGPVSAVLRMKADGVTTTVPVRGAWAVVGPPDFAPDIRPTVTLWDVLLDLAVRKLKLPTDEAAYLTGGALARLTAMAKDLAGGATAFSRYRPSFDEDVAPILRQAIQPVWVFEALQYFHGTMGSGSLSPALWKALSSDASPNTPREEILKRTRRPGTPGLKTDADMPRLLGDDPYNTFKTKRWGLTLTLTQYAILVAWAKGAFVASKLGAASLAAPPMAGVITPEGLDRAALESCSGGAFYPGIEVGWQIREPSLFAEPFRLKHGAPSAYVGEPKGVKLAAGHFSRQMALPWLADFLQCKVEKQKVTKDEWGWWPSQRPDGVYPTFTEAAKTGTMVNWHRASVGKTSDWPADATAPTPRPPDMPSYAQMVANWTKLGFVIDAKGVFAESERARAVP